MSSPRFEKLKFDGLEYNMQNESLNKALTPTKQDVCKHYMEMSVTSFMSDYPKSVKLIEHELFNTQYSVFEISKHVSKDLPFRLKHSHVSGVIHNIKTRCQKDFEEALKCNICKDILSLLSDGSSKTIVEISKCLNLSSTRIRTHLRGSTGFDYAPEKNSLLYTSVILKKDNYCFLNPCILVKQTNLNNSITRTSPQEQIQKPLQKEIPDKTPVRSEMDNHTIIKRLNDLEWTQQKYQQKSNEILSLIHQDLLSLEVKSAQKIDDLIIVFRENTSLKQQELDIIKTQFEVWKQKNNK
jgi:hypothetical protein